MLVRNLQKEISLTTFEGRGSQVDPWFSSKLRKHFHSNVTHQGHKGIRWVGSSGHWYRACHWS